MNRLHQNDILKLPISVRSWILLGYYLDERWNLDVFRKVIDDYYIDGFTLKRYSR